MFNFYAIICLAFLSLSVMNDGGIPYSIGNGLGSAYKADFSELGDYFDVYGKVQTQYSEVYWTRNDPVPLPKDIVSRFDGKVMAITGYEADQVVKTPEGDKSIPIYHQYNHHYFAWLTGKDAEIVDKEEVVSLFPNPTFTLIRDKPHTENGGFPTNIVFKENPGGEYRKSYHGYPKGFAQLIHSPTDFVLEPMQIDTHNREWSSSAYNESGHKEWFLPKMEKNKNDLKSELSPLIECPCTTRVTRSVVKHPSEILTSGSCKEVISNSDSCKSILQSIDASITTVQTISDSNLPSGCILQNKPHKGLFNKAASGSATNCGSIDNPSLNASISSPIGVNVTLSIEGHTSNAIEITLTGPSNLWFGVGFNAAKMADSPYAIIVSGETITERKLVDHGPGTVLTQSVKIVSNTVVNNMRTVILSRDLTNSDDQYFSFPSNPSSIPFITAVGNSLTFGYHKNKASGTLFLLPTENNACVCAPTETSYLTYMNDTAFEYHVNCLEKPRSDMAVQKNPACEMQTYHGGLQCCRHKTFLTDLEQAHLIPDAVDTYYLKFRYYYQEYIPANSQKKAALPSHHHLHHWVFLIDASVNDYEESRCEDGSMCEASITARLTAREMGLEDIPSNFTTITPFVIAGHCHAPSCIREELYNEDTGDLICRVEAQYGSGSNVFNESNYVALPPCLFGYQDGLRNPYTLTPDTNLLAIKVFNNTYRHLGQMAQWTGLMIYDFEKPAINN